MGIKKYKNYIEYICELCDANFGNKKDHYISHKNRIRPCVKNNNQNNINTQFAHLETDKEKNNNIDIDVHKIKDNNDNLLYVEIKTNNNNNNDNDNNDNLLCVEIKTNNNNNNNNNDTTDNLKIYPCEFCKKEFNKRFNLNRHHNTCKKNLSIKNNIKIIDDKNNIIVSPV
jgi:hypothetical protein